MELYVEFTQSVFEMRNFPEKSDFYKKSVFWEKIQKIQYFILYRILNIFAIGLWVIKIFKREIRKKKNLEALFQVITVRMIVDSSKSAYCSSCTTYSKILKS